MEWNPSHLVSLFCSKLCPHKSIESTFTDTLHRIWYWFYFAIHKHSVIGLRLRNLLKVVPKPLVFLARADRSSLILDHLCERITNTSFPAFLFIQHSALLSRWISGGDVVENSSQIWLILPDIKCAPLKRSQFKVILWQLPCRPHMRCIKEFETCQDCHGNHKRVSLFTGVFFIFVFFAYRILLSKKNKQK